MQQYCQQQPNASRMGYSAPQQTRGPPGSPHPTRAVDGVLSQYPYKGFTNECVKSIVEMREKILAFEDKIIYKHHDSEPKSDGKAAKGNHLFEFRANWQSWNPVFFYNFFELSDLFMKIKPNEGEAEGWPRAIIMKSDGTWYSENMALVIADDYEWAPDHQGSKRLPDDSIVVLEVGRYYPRRGKGRQPPEFVIINENFTWRPARKDETKSWWSLKTNSFDESFDEEDNPTRGDEEDNPTRGTFTKSFDEFFDEEDNPTRGTFGGLLQGGYPHQTRSSPNAYPQC